ncbi:MAG TPA: hypothetical protein VGN20_01725 [Mucilaginibacter sp.]|jgi:hypothetical protein
MAQRDKSKEELEREKLQLEVDQLQKSNRLNWLEKWATIIQASSVIIGIAFALNEFVFKDREATNNRTKYTLDFLNRVADKDFRKSEDSLVRYHDLAYAMSVNNRREDSLFTSLAERLPKETFELCNFYNILENGIERGYFDEQLCASYLTFDVERNINILGELQARHNGLQSKRIVPNYNGFKGLIDFYVRINHIMSKKDKDMTPQYDIDKPFRKPI